MLKGKYEQRKLSEKYNVLKFSVNYCVFLRFLTRIFARRERERERERKREREREDIIGVS